MGIGPAELLILLILFGLPLALGCVVAWLIWRSITRKQRPPGGP